MWSNLRPDDILKSEFSKYLLLITRKPRLMAKTVMKKSARILCHHTWIITWIMLYYSCFLFLFFDFGKKKPTETCNSKHLIVLTSFSITIVKYFYELHEFNVFNNIYYLWNFKVRKIFVFQAVNVDCFELILTFL